MNNSLIQLGSQLREIWKQLGLNQRVTVVVAGFAILGALAAVVAWSGRADYTLLYGRLEAAESGKVIASLDEAKIPYKVSGSGASISVPTDKVHQVRMQLAAKGIPRGGEGVGFEIFDKPNFGISDFVQRANYLRAVQGELSRTISQVDMVESARVMVVMPENRLLVDSAKRPTASVFVKVRGNAQLPPQTVAAIRFLVSNAVEGLNSNSVSVVDNLGNVLSENNDDNSITGLTTTQLAARKNLEQYFAKKAEGMLEKALGPGQAIVRVSADINFDTITKTEEVFDPDGQVVKTSVVDDETTDTTTMSENAAAKVDPATGETNSVASASPGTSNRTKKKTVNNQYEINKTTSTLAQAAGGVRNLTAAVFIAAQVTGTGTNRTTLQRSPQELEKLKRIVQGALGIKETTENPNQVTLEEMTFNDQQMVDLNQKFEVQQKRELWMEIASRSAYPLLGLIVIAFFWRAFKKTPNENIPIGIPLGQSEMDSTAFPVNGNGFPGRGRNGQPGVVTVDVLNQLIRENPENMTQAIRGWMNKSNKASKN
jgi:flagellar M-ring protein FliF